MADRTVAVRLLANVTGFVSGIGQASRATQDFVAKGLDKVAANSQHVDRLSNQVGILGIAMVGAAGAAVKAFADFDQEMSAVQAATHETSSNMGLLRQAALDAGRDTVFSASESAGAIEELAKAGVSTADILNGGLNGALSLAAAGGIDVADAAETAATALAQFKLKGTDVSHVADLLSAGANKAQGDVSDLAMALKQGGLVAAQTGLSIEETTGGLAAFAQAGLLGSDAGTSFKTMLQRLTPQSAEAQKAMDQLGISAYDSQGNFIGLAKFAGNLREAMKDLTPEARNAALATIFGSDAVRAASVLYNEGEQGIRGWISAVDDQGYAAETAATRLNNLKGDLEQFRGSVETAFIKTGEAANGPLRSLVQGATDAVNAFANAPKSIQGATLALVGGGGLVALGVAGLGKLVVGVNEAKQAMTALGISAKAAGIAAGSVGGALAAATIGFTIWAQAQADAAARVQELAASLDETTGAITDNTREVIKNNLAAEGGWWVFKKQSAFDAAQKLGIDLNTLTDAAMGNVDAMEQVNTVLNQYRGDIQGAGDAARAAGTDLADYTAAQGVVDEAVRGNSKSLEEAIRIAKQKQQADGASASSARETASATEDTTNAVEQQAKAYDDLIDAQKKAAGLALDLYDAQTNLEDAFAAGTKSIEDNGATLDINTEKGRANRDALSQVASAGWDLIDSMKQNGATQGELSAQMQTTRDRFIQLAEKMGLSAADAESLADKLNLIPKNVQAQVNVIGNAWASLDAIDSKLTSLQRKSGLTITTNLVTNESTYRYAPSGPVVKATGGYVSGPGTATSDSIPARLSNGEYVVKAASVAKYGRAFFDSVNAQRFASGGYVGAGAASSSAGLSAADIASAFDGMALTLLVDGQPIRAIARTEAVGTLRSATRGAR